MIEILGKIKTRLNVFLNEGKPDSLTPFPLSVEEFAWLCFPPGASSVSSLFTPFLTFRVLCRARSVWAFSLMTGFLLRRMNDFLKWSCVNGCSWPIRETPPSFMLFIILPISSSGTPSHEDGDPERTETPKWQEKNNGNEKGNRLNTSHTWSCYEPSICGRLIGENICRVKLGNCNY